MVVDATNERIVAEANKQVKQCPGEKVTEKAVAAKAGVGKKPKIHLREAVF